MADETTPTVAAPPIFLSTGKTADDWKALTNEAREAWLQNQQMQTGMVAKQTAVSELLKINQEARGKEMVRNAGLSVGAQAVQTGLGMLPTTTDKEMARRLPELNAMIQSGQFLSAEENALLDATLLDPARAASAENRLRAENARASMGEAATSAQAANAAEQNRMETDNKALLQAGIAKAQAHLAAKDKALTERNEFLAQKAEKEKQNREHAGQVVQGVAGLGGQVLAAQAIKGIDPKLYKDLDPQTAMLLYGINTGKLSQDDVTKSLLAAQRFGGTR